MDDLLEQIQRNRFDWERIRKRKEGVMKRRSKRPGGEQFPIQASLETELESMVAGVRSTEDDLQLKAASKFWDLLDGNPPPIAQVIQSGVVPNFVDLLHREDSPQLQYMAAGVLNNIAAGTLRDTEVVIDHPAIPGFVNLLASPFDFVKEEAMFALGNIAAASPEYRDILLSSQVLMLLQDQVNHENVALSTLRIATWTMAALFMGHPEPNIRQVRPAVPSLIRLVQSHDDEEVLAYACWAISYHLETEIGFSSAPMNLIQRLGQLLLHPSLSVLKPALRCICSLTEYRIERIITAGALPHLQSLLTGNHQNIIKSQVCWIIARITERRRISIPHLFEVGLVGPMVNLLQNQTPAYSETKKWAVTAITNIIEMGYYDQIRTLVDAGCITSMVDLLVCNDLHTLWFCLHGLHTIGQLLGWMKAHRLETLVCKSFNEAEGMSKTSKLLAHENKEISRLAGRVLEFYQTRSLEYMFVRPY